MVEVLEALLKLRAERRGAALCTVARTAGSTPRKAGAKMLVTAAGVVAGTIGGGRVEREVCLAAQALLAEGGPPRLVRFHLTRQLAMCCGGEMEILIEPHRPPEVLVVCGGGHVGRALLPLGRSLGFQTVLVEDLDELVAGCCGAAGPLYDEHIDSFSVADWRGVALGADCYVVITTREHAIDQALLEQLLSPDRPDLAYVGVIGSRRKSAVFRQRLSQRGVDPQRLARLRAPIGLSIGADTPEEIAVSIAAELVQVRASRRAAVSLDAKGTTVEMEAAEREHDAAG